MSFRFNTSRPSSALMDPAHSSNGGPSRGDHARSPSMSRRPSRDLKARLRNTRWPDDVVTDWSRGIPTSYARSSSTAGQRLRLGAQQAGLNAYSQFTPRRRPADPLLHVRSAVRTRRRCCWLHGYPSSFVEFTRMVGPLVDPEAHGGRPEDAFHVVVPSLPGSASTPARAGSRASRRPRPRSTRSCRGSATSGTASRRRHRGRDRGGALHPGRDRIIGSLVVTDPGAIATEYTPPTDHLSAEEQERLPALRAARLEDFGYLGLQTTRPQSIAYGLTDSPVTQLDLDRRESPRVDGPRQGAA